MNFCTIYKHFGGFCQLLLQIQHENNFLPTSIHRQAKVRRFSMVGHPFQNYDIVYVGFFAAYNRL